MSSIASIAPSAVPFTPSKGAVSAQATGQGRILALDGMRGLMTLFVLFSHYFGELENGIPAFCVGWIAVQMFYVLSGFLIGRLILEKKHHGNFFFVFYMRRACRTLPVYLFCIVFVFAMISIVGTQPYMYIPHSEADFPLWSYLTFTQNIFMAYTNAFGHHWLAPSWTLSVEEQFYLIAPALFVLVPARALFPVLVAGVLSAFVYRAAVCWFGIMPPLSALVFLPGCMDSLFCGLVAAWLYKNADLSKYDFYLRIAPLVGLGLVIATKQLDGLVPSAMDIFSRLFVSVGCAGYLLAVVRGAPEAQTLKSPVLIFFGNTNYAVYLTHVMVLGLCHGLILGTAPDLATPAQWAVTLVALPIAILVGWVITRYVEEPITAFGRSFAWK
jgi:peptidoglycan/LPS O-acetylase OafA/YrhL